MDIIFELLIVLYIFMILGYSTELIGDKPAPSLVPRQVIHGLKKIKIVAAATSKYHTAVVSSNGLLFTWGLNLGQLGEFSY